MRIASPTRRLALPLGRQALLIALSVVLLSFAAPPALADVGQTIIDRCTHGQSLSGFSQAAYHQALQELPTEVEEYSPCGNEIRRAQLAAAAGANGGQSAATAATPIAVTPAERTALNSAPKLAAGAVQVGNQTVRPGVIHANVASALSSLPDSLLAVLAFLFACALLLAGRALKNRVHADRPR